MSKVQVDLKGVIDQLNKFANAGIRQTAVELEKQVIREISEGRSPVKGKRRFKRYSESYRSVINGEKAFFTNSNGKVVVIESVDDIETFRPSQSARRQNERNQEFIEDFTEQYEGKSLSPVNLKVTGTLLRSIFSRAVGSNKLVIGFDNFLADIHNRQGAGKSKVVRRMLPTNKGETFSDSIFEAILARLNKIANRVFK